MKSIDLKTWYWSWIWLLDSLNFLTFWTQSYLTGEGDGWRLWVGVACGRGLEHPFRDLATSSAQTSLFSLNSLTVNKQRPIGIHWGALVALSLEFLKFTNLNSLLNIFNTYMHVVGFPCGSAGKESTCHAGDLGSIPGLGRSPREGKGYPLQYSGLGNSMDYNPWGRRVRHDWVTFNFHFTCSKIIKIQTNY